MRNLTAIVAALGLLVATSMPTFAATTDFSAAKKPTAAACKKNPKLKGCDKMSSLTTTDFSAAKKPSAAACKKNPKLKGCPKM